MVGEEVERGAYLMSGVCWWSRGERRGRTWKMVGRKREIKREKEVVGGRRIGGEFIYGGGCCYKEASKMNILSKTWLQAWSTLPDLEFCLHRGKCNIKIVDTIMERYRDGKVPIEKFELSRRFSYDPHKVLPPIPIDNCLDITLQNGVKHLVLDCISYSAPILTILAAKSLRKLVLTYCTLSLASGVMNQNSLRKLSLSHVKLDKHMFETLLNSCPLIDTLIFVHCIGLEKVYLRKIKTVYLKVLKIRDSEGMWKIDAPNLVSFEYTGKQIPKFKIARQLENSKLYLYRLDNINADWFYKLRKFLSKSTGASWSQVSIRFKECTEIKMEHLQQHYRVGKDATLKALTSTALMSPFPSFRGIQLFPIPFTVASKRAEEFKFCLNFPKYFPPKSLNLSL
ncbi:hypothetical protein H5410_029879 [Solanum commersonii]|uniref:At1g61320/AtMIF1 LRR domain-containing protein n=1 Tax=Solanum commersonii TaxID=4109 RepID=A0A9J5YEI3_SOLCO|nr:hypothetical protein H5410_029879 [Solanum commersonii]